MPKHNALVYSLIGFNMLLFMLLNFIAYILPNINFGYYDALIIYTSLSSVPLIKPTTKYLTKAEREALRLNDSLKEILVGLILGDLTCRKKGIKGDARFIFKQGLIHTDYLNHLFELFKEYTASGPGVAYNPPHPKTGKVYANILFETRTLPCLTQIYNIFYIEGKKVVPGNLIDLFTPLSLAYWIADDGSWNKVGKYVTLCTDSFKLLEVEQLILVLNTKFNFKCYKVKCNKNYRIIIPSYSIVALQNLISEHIPPMMKHKIGLQ
uniref:LAGLIDADG homing endonuclease n=1 Tax=Phanerochaete carnosa TaxID=231932 RepID=A0A895KU75_9APHY|nr:LAGLIDADG homing endonuclease [Phanerochaete carnosa]QRZ60359.1 LAGLIDADG homing endonuclease [Phanerochaete carnosa]